MNQVFFLWNPILFDHKTVLAVVWIYVLWNTVLWENIHTNVTQVEKFI